MVNESDPTAYKSYSKTRYVDFLEIISRVATIMFDGSEMEEEPLQWKLEHVIQELFVKMPGR